MVHELSMVHELIHTAKNVKLLQQFLHEKIPGTSYTRSQLKDAYVKFLNDGSDSVALDLEERLPGKFLEFSNSCIELIQDVEQELRAY